MTTFSNKNPSLQSVPITSTLLDIPNDELKPWWSEIRTTLSQQLYTIQNGGIFNAPILTNATIKQAAISEVTIVGVDGSTGQFNIVAGALVYVGSNGTQTTIAPA